MVAEDGFGAWLGLDAKELGADRQAAIGADLDAGALAPDKGPPGTGGFRAQHGAFFFESAGPSLLGFHFEFAVDFVLVAMKAQGLDLRIGLIEIGDVFTGEVGGQALLPEEMCALDFALGLRGGGVAEGDAVEVKGLAQLGERFGIMREEEAVKVHVDFQW